jgi:hypothetical protein
MKIDAFAHILSSRYRERVFELLRARGDTSAADYERMMGLDPTLTSVAHRYRGNDVPAGLRRLPRALAEAQDHRSPQRRYRPDAGRAL